MPISSLPEIKYIYTNINDIKMNFEKTETGKTIITNLEVNNERLQFSQRFIVSLCSLYGISKSIFNLYDPDEVLERIYDRRSDDRTIRLTVHDNKALAVTKPERPIITGEDLETIFSQTGIEDWEYSDDGIITSHHNLRIGDNKLTINGDNYINQFVVNTPIDGYGLPSSYVSMYRLVCSNLMIVKSRLFKSSIKLGNKIENNIPQMVQFIESFNNEKAYQAIQQRLETAMRSPASLDEIHRLSEILDNEKLLSIHTNPSYIEDTKDILVDSDQLKVLRKLMGSEADKYGLISLNSLDKKKRQRVPSETTVYNLINFVSELATHHAAEKQQSTILYGYIGDMISREYDLENILDEGQEPIDLFLSVNQN